MRVLPLSRTHRRLVDQARGPALLPAENPNADYQAVTPGYFQAMGLRVVRGAAAHRGRPRGRAARWR